jgi:hypothetical protein
MGGTSVTKLDRDFATGSLCISDRVIKLLMPLFKIRCLTSRVASSYSHVDETTQA